MRPLRVLADDLTGALDTAAAFGAGVPVWLGRPGGAEPAPIEVLATATRDVPPGALDEALQPVLPWFGASGVRPFKKVDSLLRGNTFDEIDRCARALGNVRVLLAPAFPRQGRETREGRLWVRPPGADRIEPSGVSPHQAMTARGWAVSPTLSDSGIWLPDIGDDAALREVARAVWQREAARPDERWLWVGSAGLAQALVAAVDAPDAPVAIDAALPAGPTFDGPQVLISASHHAVSRRQWDRLAQVRADWPLARAGRIDERDALIRSTAKGRCAGFDLAAHEALTPDEAQRRLDDHARALVRGLPRPAGLVVVGGDTLLALCRASGAQAMRSMPPPSQAGWGRARLIGGVWDGLPCRTRSGAFGGDDDLVEVLAGA